MKSDGDSKTQLCGCDKDVLDQILMKMLNDIKFGSITISVQNGKIVNIEKNEKFRLNEL